MTLEQPGTFMLACWVAAKAVHRMNGSISIFTGTRLLSTSCRVPQEMPWADFWNGVFVPYHEEDLDFDASAGWEQFDWFLAVNRDQEPISPSEQATLADLGLTHKAVLGFSAK